MEADRAARQRAVGEEILERERQGAAMVIQGGMMGRRERKAVERAQSEMQEIREIQEREERSRRERASAVTIQSGLRGRASHADL